MSLLLWNGFMNYECVCVCEREREMDTQARGHAMHGISTTEHAQQTALFGHFETRDILATPAQQW
jgi:hypothetical protein